MAEDNSGNSKFSQMIRDPYFFKPLNTARRKIIQFIGNWPHESIEGGRLLQFTKDHDTIRMLVSWNFLTAIHDTELPEYEPVLFVGDFDISYRITDQAREFVKLELNNISDLNRAILIFLRADCAPEMLIGLARISIPTIKFYDLVILLNKSEQAILAALKRLESMGLVELKLVFTEDGRVYHRLSKFAITNKGILFLEKGDIGMTFSNINIVNSNVGVVSLQSTLTNIDTSVGNIKQKGHAHLAEVLTKLTEQVTASALSGEDKQEVLEQVELIGEQAEKEPNDRKPSIVKGALAFMEKALMASAGLSTIWATCGPAIRKFFGI